MKLTLSVSYGIGILLQIMENSRDGPMTATRIARGCRFPPRFLYRVLHKLVAAGLLTGTSGPGGGYTLALRPDRISLLDIVTSVDNEPEPSVLEPACSRQRRAIAHVNRLCRESADEFAAELDQVSLADLERMVRGRRRTVPARGR